MRQLLAVIWGLWFLSVVSGIAQAKSTNPADTLVYGEMLGLETLDPYTANEASGQRLADLLFDGLITVEGDGQYRPHLAETWNISEDGTAVTFTLRENVRWHGTQDDALTADDVAATVRLLRQSASQLPNGERFAVLKGAEVLSPRQVKIQLTQALVDPLRVLLFKILPAKHLPQNGILTRDLSFAKHPIGTGPYQLQEVKANGEVLLVAHPQYFLGAPKIPKIILKGFADQNVMMQTLMFGALDLVTYVSPRHLREIRGDREMRVVPYDALSFAFFGFNNAKGMLRDKRVRQALTLTVNRQEMLQAFFQNQGQIISGPFPPSSWAYNLDVKPLPFDPNRAQRLLTEAGYNKNAQGLLTDHDGQVVKLVFVAPVTGESETIKKLALALQGYLAAVGITVETQFTDWVMWKKRVFFEHSYDLTIGSWSFDDAANITSLFHSSSRQPWGNNFVQYQSMTVDAHLTEANATNDFDKRRAIYQKLHAILADDAPYLYLWTLTQHAAHQNRVQKVKVEPYAFFKFLRFWELGTPAGDNNG